MGMPCESATVPAAVISRGGDEGCAQCVTLNQNLENIPALFATGRQAGKAPEEE